MLKTNKKSAEVRLNEFGALLGVLCDKYQELSMLIAPPAPQVVAEPAQECICEKPTQFTPERIEEPAKEEPPDTLEITPIPQEELFKVTQFKKDKPVPPKKPRFTGEEPPPKTKKLPVYELDEVESSFEKHLETLGGHQVKLLRRALLKKE